MSIKLRDKDEVGKELCCCKHDSELRALTSVESKIVRVGAIITRGGSSLDRN